MEEGLQQNKQTLAIHINKHTSLICCLWGTLVESHLKRHGQINF